MGDIILVVMSRLVVERVGLETVEDADAWIQIPFEAKMLRTYALNDF